MKFESQTMLPEIDNTVSVNQTTGMKITAGSYDNSFKKDLKKVFSRADLWNIHRQRKNAVTRRYY